jgi:hypothetical protein
VVLSLIDPDLAAEFFQNSGPGHLGMKTSAWFRFKY